MEYETVLRFLLIVGLVLHLGEFRAVDAAPNCDQILSRRSMDNFKEILAKKSEKRPATAAVVGKRSLSCDNILPGLEVMQRGVDLAQLDFVPVGQNKERGFKSVLLDFSCDKGHKFSVDGKAFQRPDQVSNVVRRPSGEFSYNADVYESSEEVLHSWGVTAGLGVDFPGGSFSASSSYKSVSKSLTKSSTSVEEVKVEEFVRVAVLREGYNLKLSEDAREFVDCLPDKFDAGSAAYYQRFIEKFGSHYLKKAQFGGTLRFIFTTTSDSTEKTNSQSLAISAEAEVKFVIGVKVSAGMSKEDEDNWKSFRKQTSKKISYIGGDTNLIDGTGLKTWQPTVKKSPALIGGKVRPVYELVSHRGKRIALVKAIQVHLDKSLMRAGIEDLKAINADGRATLSIIDRSKKLTSELSKLVNMVVPDHQQVQAKAAIVEELKREKKNGDPCSDNGNCVRGTCVNGKNREYSCICPPHFTGKNCEKGGNQWSECYGYCGSKGGYCEWCPGGLCCRKYWNEYECRGKTACLGYHCCTS